MVAANGKIVASTVWADGAISFVGKGGVSAGNPLTANITIYINSTAFGHQPSNVTVKLPGAFAESGSTYDQYGIPHWIAIDLVGNGNYWVSEGIRVKYAQGGTEALVVVIDGQEFEPAESIQVSAQDVTVSTTTNSLILSLTWAILALMVLELRVEDKRCNCKNNRNDDHTPNAMG